MSKLFFTQNKKILAGSIILLIIVLGGVFYFFQKPSFEKATLEEVRTLSYVRDSRALESLKKIIVSSADPYVRERAVFAAAETAKKLKKEKEILSFFFEARKKEENIDVLNALESAILGIREYQGQEAVAFDIGKRAKVGEVVSLEIKATTQDIQKLKAAVVDIITSEKEEAGDLVEFEGERYAEVEQTEKEKALSLVFKMRFLAPGKYLLETKTKARDFTGFLTELERSFVISIE